MHRLAELSLKNRALIALVTIAVALFGTISMTQLKQELVPSISLPVVSVVTTYPGASPEIVDNDVSTKVEASMRGLEGLASSSATSSAGVSTVTLQFDYGTDLVYAQQRIQQALDRTSSQLPSGIQTNVVSGSIADLPVVRLAVSAPDGTSMQDLAQRIRTSTLGDLRDIAGVRDATLSGDPQPRIAITPDQAALAAAGLGPTAITDALKTAGVLVPIGQVADAGTTLTVEAGTPLTSADDLARIPLTGARAGSSPTLGDVAKVVLDTQPATTISRVDGAAALTISVTKTPAANTVDVSKAVRAALPDLQPALGTGVTITPVFDQAPFIEQSIETLVVEGLLGLFFAIIVIFAFLFSLRSTIVTAISIPTSLLVTFIGLQAAHYSLNILTLGALTIAIGRVVDDSIVVIENIKRHMAMHPAAGRRGEERARVIVDSVREVAGAVTAATVSTVAVYLPIAFVSDISGELFRPFALTSVIALLASLVVSLTIVPVLAYWMLGGSRARSRAKRAAGTPPSDLLPVPRSAGSRGGADAGAESEAGMEGDGSFGATGAAGSAGPTAGAALASTASASAQPLRARPRRERAEQDAVQFAPLGLRDEPERPRSRRELREAREREAAEARGAGTTATSGAGLGPNGATAVASTGTAADGRSPLVADAVAAAGPAADGAAAPGVGAGGTGGDALGFESERAEGWLARAYAPVIRWVLSRPWTTLGAALLVLVLTGILAPFMKTNFLGDSGNNAFTVTQEVAPNASLQAIDEGSRAIEQALISTPDVETVQLTISAPGAGGSSFSLASSSGPRVTFSVTAGANADVQTVQDRVRERLATVPGGDKTTIGTGGSSSGFSSNLTVSVTAPTQELLREGTAKITEALSTASGLRDVTSSLDESRPFVRLTVDHAAAAAAGLNEQAIGGIVAQRLGPVPAGNVLLEGQTVRVFLLSGTTAPDSIIALRDLEIPTATGPKRLSELAAVDVVNGPVTITTEHGGPSASVTATPVDDNLGAANTNVRAALRDLALPDGVQWELGGVSADQSAAFAQLGLALLAAILIVYVVMVATFKSLLQPLLLLVSVPFAATGAVLLQIATGVPLGVASLIGVLMLIGIVVTNAIVLVDLVNQFRARGADVAHAVVEGGVRRVRPIVMTALATVLALTPMALGVTGHSGFISQPLAIVVIGGLLSSTALTLLVLPALYAIVEGPIERRRMRRRARVEGELAGEGL